MTAPNSHSTAFTVTENLMQSSDDSNARPSLAAQDEVARLLGDLRDYLWPNQDEEWEFHARELCYRIDDALAAPLSPLAATRDDVLNLHLSGILDSSLDAEDVARLKKAQQCAKEVLDDVEAAPKSGPLKRDLNDNESILAWAVDYLTDALAGAQGVASALKGNAAPARTGENPIVGQADQLSNAGSRESASPCVAVPLDDIDIIGHREKEGRLAQRPRGPISKRPSEK